MHSLFSTAAVIHSSYHPNTSHNNNNNNNNEEEEEDDGDDDDDDNDDDDDDDDDDNDDEEEEGDDNQRILIIKNHAKGDEEQDNGSVRAHMRNQHTKEKRCISPSLRSSIISCLCLHSKCGGLFTRLLLCHRSRARETAIPLSSPIAAFALAA